MSNDLATGYSSTSDDGSLFDLKDENLLEEIAQKNHGQRFNLHPQYRIPAIIMTTGIFGVMSGFYEGSKVSSLKYLAENAHRLPKSKGGWYFYHKRKNYVLLKDGITEGVKYGSKLSIMVGGYFCLEAYLDHLRGKIDFMNSIAATMTAGLSYGVINGLSRRQTANVMRKGFGLGLSVGLIQDLLIYARGGDVWYLKYVGLATHQEMVEPTTV